MFVVSVGDKHGRKFVLRHTPRPKRRLYPICTSRPWTSALQALACLHWLFVNKFNSIQAGAKTSDTGAEAVKPDPGSSWEGHSEWMGAGVGVGDENSESCGAIRPLHIPLVIRPLRRTYVVVVSSGVFKGRRARHLPRAPLFWGPPLRYYAHKFSLFLVKDVLQVV